MIGKQYRLISAFLHLESAFLFWINEEAYLGSLASSSLQNTRHCTITPCVFTHVTLFELPDRPNYLTSGQSFFDTLLAAAYTTATKTTGRFACSRNDLHRPPPPETGPDVTTRPRGSQLSTRRPNKRNNKGRSHVGMGNRAGASEPATHRHKFGVDVAAGNDGKLGRYRHGAGDLDETERRWGLVMQEGYVWRRPVYTKRGGEGEAEPPGRRSRRSTEHSPHCVFDALSMPAGICRRTTRGGCS